MMDEDILNSGLGFDYELNLDDFMGGEISSWPQLPGSEFARKVLIPRLHSASDESNPVHTNSNPGCGAINQIGLPFNLFGEDDTHRNKKRSREEETFCGFGFTEERLTKLPRIGTNGTVDTTEDFLTEFFDKPTDVCDVPNVTVDDLLDGIGYRSECQKAVEELMVVLDEKPQPSRSQEDIECLNSIEIDYDAAYLEELDSRPPIVTDNTLHLIDGTSTEEREAMQLEKWCPDDLQNYPEEECIEKEETLRTRRPTVEAFMRRLICCLQEFSKLRWIRQIAYDTTNLEYQMVDLFEKQVCIKELIDRSIETFLDYRTFVYNSKFKVLKNAIAPPYFKAPCGDDYLVGPILNPDVHFQYVPRKCRHWKPTECRILERSVKKSYFHRRMFFIESRFEQMLLNCGFSVENISVVAAHWHRFEDNLWQLELDRRISSSEKIIKSEFLLDQYIQEESNIFNLYIKYYKKKKKEKEKGLQRCLVTSLKNQGITVSIKVNDLIKWKQKEVKAIIKDRINDGKIDLSRVDWLMVAKDVAAVAPKRGSPDACERLYRISMSDLYNQDPTSHQEVETLKLLTEKTKISRFSRSIDWPTVLERFGAVTKRSPIRIFDTWRTHIYNKNKRYRRKLPKREVTIKKILKHKGSITSAIIEMRPKYGEISYRRICSQWKTWNPHLVKGYFTVLDDTALLVAMEVLRPKYYGKTFDFSAILPWRYRSSWQGRAELLFRKEHNSQFTIEEDRLLLKLVCYHGKQWVYFSDTFVGKSRKVLASRHKYLMKRLKVMSLEELHVLYSRRKPPPNRLLPRLRQVAAILRKMIALKFLASTNYYLALAERNEKRKTTKRALTYGMTRKQYLEMFIDHPPTTQEIFKYVFTFDVKVLIPVFTKLVNYLVTADSEPDPDPPSPDTDCLIIENSSSSPSTTNEVTIEYCGYGPPSVCSSTENYPEICNRRKFDINDPMSVASALQLRRISLKSINDSKGKPVKIEDSKLNAFEKNIYKYYRMFAGRHSTKKMSHRSGIPTALELTKIDKFKNIIIVPEKKRRPLAVKKGKISEEPVQSLNKLIPRKSYPKVVFKTDLAPDKPSSSTIETENNEPPKTYQHRIYGKNASRGPSKKTLVKQKKSAAAKARWAKKEMSSSSIKEPFTPVELNLRQVAAETNSLPHHYLVVRCS